MARIAWIEDDHNRIGSLVKLLENEGHTIVPYTNLKEVTDNIEEICRCDAIILDIILPTNNADDYLGLSILEKLRKQHDYQGPVVVCSRIQNPVVIEQLRELGVSDILRKPTRPTALTEAVKKAMGGD